MAKRPSKPKPPPKRVLLGVRALPELKTRAMAAAAADRRSLSSWVEIAIEAALERKK